MAAKTFTCVICQAEVSKPQSYAYKDGRACRHHPEVQEAHTSSEQAKKDNLEQSKYRAENPGHRWKHLREPEMTRNEMFTAMGLKDPNKHCWCCHKDGVYEHIVLERYLINFSKSELQKPETVPVFEVIEGQLVPNQEVRDKVRQDLGNYEVVLRRMDVPKDYPDWKLKQVLNQKGREDKMQLVRMTGIIVLCKDCANEYDFQWRYASDNIKTKEQLEHMMLVGHLIKPTLHSIAAGEIARDELSVIMNKGK